MMAKIVGNADIAQNEGFTAEADEGSIRSGSKWR